MTLELFVAVSAGETRILLTRDGIAIEVFHDRLNRWPGLGCLLDGRVEEVRKDLGGAFVGLGRGLTGFLPKRAWPDANLQPGDPLAVKVTRMAHDDKGPRLSTRLTLPGTMAPGQWRELDPAPAMIFTANLSPQPDCIWVDDPGWVERLEAFYDAAGLPAVPVSLDQGGGISDQISEIVGLSLEPAIPVPGGGAIHIAETRACTTIDVDSGLSRQPALAVNKSAVPVIARALGLRGIGGLIVIDFIGMKRAAGRKQIESELRLAMKQDRETGDILPLSRLGLLEMSRSRRGPSLRHLYLDTSGHPLAEAAALEVLRQVESGMKSIKSPRVQVTVAKEISDWLTRHEEVLKAAGNRWLKPLEWRPVAGQAFNDVRIEEK